MQIDLNLLQGWPDWSEHILCTVWSHREVPIFWKIKSEILVNLVSSNLVVVSQQLPPVWFFFNMSKFWSRWLQNTPAANMLTAAWRPLGARPILLSSGAGTFCKADHGNAPQPRQAHPWLSVGVREERFREHQKELHVQRARVIFQNDGSAFQNFLNTGLFLSSWFCGWALHFRDCPMEVPNSPSFRASPDSSFSQFC